MSRSKRHRAQGNHFPSTLLRRGSTAESRLARGSVLRYKRKRRGMLSELSTITGGFLNVAGSGSYPRLPVDSADLKSSFQNTSIAPLLRPTFRMQNWIGIGIWIVLGATIGLVMKVLIKRPDETPGHTIILMVLGSFAAVIGGCLLYTSPSPRD